MKQLLSAGNDRDREDLHKRKKENKGEAKGKE